MGTRVHLLSALGLLLLLTVLQFLLNEKDELSEIMHSQPVQFTWSYMAYRSEVAHVLITQRHYVSAQ
jgi:hypothetical protein